MQVLLILPIVIPFVFAIIAVLAWRQRQIQRMLALTGTLGLLLAGFILLFSVLENGIQMTAIGNWPPPFGITLVADLFSAIMVVMAGIMGVSIVIFSIVSMDEARRSYGYYPLVLFLMMGMCGAFLTGDMFNLFVWFEVILISSFVLLTLGGERPQMEGAIKYFSLNLLVSAFFLGGVGIIYAIAGTLNMADLAQTLPQVENQGLVMVVAMMLLVAFGIKSALFPMFFWLPASYHTPPVAITTLFSGLMTKAGVYALVRVFTLVFTQDVAFTHNLILIISGFTMVVGVFGAVAQYDFRRLLSFHIISQIGYLIMGLGIFTVASLTGTIYFMIHVIIAKSALFLVSGIVSMIAGTYDLKKLGGFYRGFPALALFFIVPALALGGIPPLSGFWAKLLLVIGGLEAEQYLIVGVALFVSIFTLFSMTKIWAEAFWKDSPEIEIETIKERVAAVPANRMVVLLLPLIILATLTVVMGIAADPVIDLATQAAEQLMNPEGYIEVVLGAAP